MRIGKKIGLLVLTGLIGIQAFRPDPNKGDGVSPNNIAAVIAIPQEVQETLKAACYDCHSNNTVYPWYANIQPAGWWLADHIKEGKAELNFNEFGSYTKRKQIRKLKSIASQIEEKEMPLKSYSLMHASARLTDAQQTYIISWAKAAADSLSSGE